MPVATRSLARVRHAEDFGDILRNLKAEQSNDGIPPYVSDAMWLEDLCRARQNLLLPWGVTRPNELVRLVDAVAREVMAATNTNDLAADLRPEFIKCFTLESADFGQIHLSLPTRLRHRQWVLGQVGHVLRWAPEARTTHSSWSVASIERLAPACGWPEGALAWVCPKAAELVRLKHDLLRKFNFSPKYFKACAALRASILGEA